MSVISKKFVGFFRNLVHKSDTSHPAQSPVIPVKSAPVGNGHAPVAGNRPVPANTFTPVNGNGNCIQIPLGSILISLPLELRGRVRPADVSALTVPVAVDKILPQLSSGVVKVPFGEVRRAQGHVFTASADRDEVDLVLPLAEILSRLNPAMFVRRAGQKNISVPAEISSPFGDLGQGLVFSIGQAKPEAAAAQKVSAPAPTPALAPISPIAMSPVTPATQAKNPFIPPPLAIPGQVFQRTRTPGSPSTPVSPVGALGKPALPVSLKPALPPKEKDPLMSMPVPRAIRPAEPAKPVEPIQMAKSSPVTAPPESSPISVALSALAEGWPETLRQEIVKANLSEARLALPSALVEASLKRGRVVFPWKAVRSWIRPTAPANVSVHDATEVELPLSVLAPLFFGRQKSDTKFLQRRVAIDETIPNLFFGLPTPEPATAPVAAMPPINKVVDTNYYVWDDVHDTARVDETEFKRKPGGTDFVTKYATPNEIVSRAAVLDGVVGVVIALPDGLMVANRIPPELNGDTLAAFLPQIFGKVSQATKELRMGELNNLSFSVGNVPWKIFRVNAIYFAAFGRVGEALPTAPLAALAGELDHKNR